MRKSLAGRAEEFSVREALMLLRKINAKERRSRVTSRLQWARKIFLVLWTCCVLIEKKWIL